MKFEKRLRRIKRKENSKLFFSILEFKKAMFFDYPADTSLIVEQRFIGKPTKDPSLSNHGRLKLYRESNGRVGMKRHGRYTQANLIGA